MRTPERQRPSVPFRYSPLVAALACALGQQAFALTFTVTSNGDDGSPGTLRGEITAALAACGTAPHTIAFSGPFVISPSYSLPQITCGPLTIQGAPGVILDGSAMTSTACGLYSFNGWAKITGLEVRNFSYGGASYGGLCGTLEAVGNNVHSNTKGFYLTGSSVITNNQIHDNVQGIYETGSGSTISGNTINLNSSEGIFGGGNMVLSNNTISGNSGWGVHVWSSATATGNTISNNSSGIYAQAGSIIKGNTIHGHGVEGTGIYLYDGGVIGGPGADRNVVYNNDTNISASNGTVYGGPVTIENNYVGVMADGSTASGGSIGIIAYGMPAATISNNVVAGNSWIGMNVADVGSLTIQGNKVGTNAAGTAALGNGYGIDVSYTYGGQIDNNVVAGNAGRGIALYSSGNLTISANKVGTDVSGTVGLANGIAGIEVEYSYGILITGNQISANGSSGGVVLDSVSVTTLQGNLIGTAADGISALSNNGPGVTIGFNNVAAFSAADLEPKVAKILTSGNLLVDNVIAHNNGDGVKLFTGSNNNRITGSVSGQSIHSNNGKNINLDYSPGPRPNNVPESSGPNGGQNRPNIVSVVEDSGSTVIQGSLLSFAPGSVFVNDLPFNGQFEIDLYGNDIPGVPAGKTWLGKTTAVTNVSGVANFSATIAGTGFGYVTATATGPFGTSEFSDTLQALTPAASITPMNVPFGNVPVGTTATTPVEIAFRSNGTGNYMIDSISQGATAPTCPATSTPVCATGDFSCSVSCTVGMPYPPLLSPTLPPSCKISGLSFHPTTVGAKSTTLWVCDNAGPAPRAITLTGTAVANVAVSLSPWDVAFGAVPTGTTSPSRTIAISNNGENGVPLSGLSVSGPYTLVGSTCGTSLPPMSFCEAQVAFAPVAPGLAEGAFSAQIGVEGAPPYIARLSGTGTQQASLALPGAIDFGTMLRGEPPRVNTQELRNTGNALLTFSASVSGPFALSGTCGTSLAPGAACTLIITFTPSTVGDFAGSLDISSNAPGGSGSTLITARVQAQPRPDIRVDVSEMGFGDRMIGTRSAPQRVTVSNLGTVAAQLGVVPPTRDFIATSQCGATLAPGASCTTDVAFMPMAFGQRLNRLQFTSDAPGSPFGVDLSGRGCSPPRPGRPPSCN